MPRWRVEITEAAQKEVLSLPNDIQARFLHVAEMLEAGGPQKVGMPHTRPLGSKLWEMRIPGRDGIARAIYFAASGQRLVVVRAFIKKTQKTPKHDIDLALKRAREHGND